MFTLEGDAQALQSLWQGEQLPTSVFVGLCDQEISKSTVMSDIVTEPTSGVGGYARIELLIGAVDFPTLALINGYYRIVSKPITFTPVGVDFDAATNYAFLCADAAGTSGKLFAGTAPLLSSGATVVTVSQPLTLAIPIYRR